MKRFSVLATLLLALSFFVSPAFGEEGEKNGKDVVMSFLAKYKDVQGFEAQTFVKGEGLGIVKAQMGKKMGKSLMRGVTVITMVDYSEVDSQVCNFIHEDYDQYFSKFTEVDTSDSTKTSTETEKPYTRTFINLKEEEKAITDFITVVEDQEFKVFLYMGGVIKAEDFKNLSEAK